LTATLEARQGGRATGDPEQTVRAFLVPFGNGDRAGFMRYFAETATVFLPAGAFPAERVTIGPLKGFR
jgi:hypothetical protein